MTREMTMEKSSPLHIPELVRLIAWMCDTRGDTAALIATSRFFYQTAWDVLWRHIPSLFTVLSVLPPEARHRDIRLHGSGKLTETLSILRPLQDDEWERLVNLASCVQVIGIPELSPAPTPRLQDALGIYLLETLSDPRFLFPKLTELHWHADPAHSYHLLTRLLNPSLTILTISNYPSPDASIFALPPLTPRLQHFGLVTEDENPEPLSSTLTLWPELRSVHCGLINAQAISYLAASNRLESARFAVSSRGVDAFKTSLESHPPSRTVCFPSASYLQFVHCPIDEPDAEPHLPILTKFLGCMRIAPIALELHLCSVLWPGSMIDLFTAVSQCCDSSRLERFVVIEAPNESYEIYTEDEYALSFHDVAPLSALPNLVEVSLDTRRRVVLNDEQLLALAQFWPRIEELKINETAGWGSPHVPQVTFGGIRDVLQSRPELKVLTLAVDTTSIARVDFDDAKVLDSALKVLDVLDSAPADERDEVIAFLCRTAPGLEQLRSWQNECSILDDSDESNAWWDDVRRLIEIGRFVVEDG